MLWRWLTHWILTHRSRIRSNGLRLHSLDCDARSVRWVRGQLHVLVWRSPLQVLRCSPSRGRNHRETFRRGRMLGSLDSQPARVVFSRIRAARPWGAPHSRGVRCFGHGPFLRSRGSWKCPVGLDVTSYKDNAPFVLISRYLLTFT